MLTNLQLTYNLPHIYFKNIYFISYLLSLAWEWLSFVDPLQNILFKFVHLVVKYILKNNGVSTYTLHVTLIVAHMSNRNEQYAEIVPGIFLYCTTLVCMLPIKRSSFAQVFSASSDRRMRRIPDAVCVCVCVCVCVGEPLMYF